MSILIKGMEMPKSCDDCCVNVDCWCMATIKPNDYSNDVYDYMNNGTKPDWCPLIEIPPHGRLIDASEISEHKYATIPQYRKEIAEGKTKSDDEAIAFKHGWNYAIDSIIENAPTIIEAEDGE